MLLKPSDDYLDQPDDQKKELSDFQQTKVYKYYKTAGDFHRSPAKIRFLGGCAGIGKTVTMLKDSQIRAAHQEPYFDHQYPNGIRHTKFLFTRKTRNEIKRAIVDVMEEWFEPHALTTWSQPDRAEYKYLAEDGTTVKAEYHFIGLDDEDAMSKIDSLNYTEVYINEAHHLTFKQFGRLRIRGGRFPVGKVECTNGGCSADFNPPDLQHWIMQKVLLKPIPGDSGEIISDVYMVPAPVIRKKGRIRDPNGHYINGYTYFKNPKDEASFIHEKVKNGVRIDGTAFWIDMIGSLTDRDIKSLVLSEFVPSREGQPVYENYNAKYHLSPVPLVHNPYKAVEIAFDFGHDAACIIGQKLDNGMYGLLHEQFADGAGLQKLLDDLAPTLKSRFEGCVLDVTYDPSDRKLEGKNDLRQSQRVLKYLKEMGFRVRMTPSKNQWESRREAFQLMLDVDSALIIDPSMVMVISSLMGEYCFPKKKSGGYALRPDKTDKFSHVMDCCEYLAIRNAARYLKSKAFAKNKRKQRRVSRSRRVR